MSEYLRCWEEIGAPNYIVNIIKGYKLPFVRKPPIIRLSTNHTPSPQTPAMRDEIIKMLNQKILEPSIHPSGFLSKMFPRKKSNGKLRPIFNLKGLNQYLSPKKFRLISHLRVPDFLQKGDFMAKIDIHQAYFHIPVSPQHRRFLSMTFENKFYQMTCMPFGLSTAPITFAKITNWLANRLRDMGIRIIVYLDDFLIANQNSQILIQHTQIAKAMLTKLGWVLNEEKSSTLPRTEIEFLGLIWNTDRCSISLPSEKKTSISQEISKIQKARHWSWASAKRLLGKLNFATMAIPMGRLRSRNLQRASLLYRSQNPEKFFQRRRTR